MAQLRVGASGWRWKGEAVIFPRRPPPAFSLSLSLSQRHTHTLHTHNTIKLTNYKSMAPIWPAATLPPSSSFSLPTVSSLARRRSPISLHHPPASFHSVSNVELNLLTSRRQLSILSVGLLSSALWNSNFESNDGVAFAAEFADMPALRGKDYGKTKMRFPDYTETESGLQYKDLRDGNGPTPKAGQTVVVDWDGYTIGYYGRIFEARNKTKGGSFEGDDKDFFKFKLGSGEVIPAFEEAVSGMALGGIRRIIVPPELGYPENDYNKSAPRPTTFSGQRALDFVLRNRGLIDKTLLFDIELLKIIPS